MQRDTFVVRQTFLQWLHKRSNPGRIVNLCFLIVLVFSTLLTWREVVVLEEAYISSQRNHLDTVASSLDRQLQNSVDRMLLFRQGMHDAIETPLAFDVLQDAVSRFNTVRMLPTWQLAVDKKRTLPINGVSDAFVDKTTLLNRDAERISHEISAALEVGYLLRLASSRAQTEARVIYVSRAGFSFPRIRRIGRVILPPAIIIWSRSPGLPSSQNVTTAPAPCAGLSPRLHPGPGMNARSPPASPSISIITGTASWRWILH